MKAATAATAVAAAVAVAAFFAGLRHSRLLLPLPPVKTSIPIKPREARKEASVRDEGSFLTRILPPRDFLVPSWMRIFSDKVLPFF